MWTVRSSDLASKDRIIAAGVRSKLSAISLGSSLHGIRLRRLQATQKVEVDEDCQPPLPKRWFVLKALFRNPVKVREPSGAGMQTFHVVIGRPALAAGATPSGRPRCP